MKESICVATKRGRGRRCGWRRKSADIFSAWSKLPRGCVVLYCSLACLCSFISSSKAFITTTSPHPKSTRDLSIVSLHVRHRHAVVNNNHSETDPHLFASSPEQLTKAADLLLKTQHRQLLYLDDDNNGNNDNNGNTGIQHISNRNHQRHHHHHQQQQQTQDATATDNTIPATRRWFFASTLLTASAALATTTTAIPTSPATAVDLDQLRSAQKLNNWKVTPINKRTGVTVFDVERLGYTVGFVTYLSRFLLCFDADCQKWWWNRAADIPRLASIEQVQKIRLEQFAAFSASVEVGLQAFKQTNGPERLLQSLVKRYCPSMEQVRLQRAAAGLPPLSEAAEGQQEREIKEARRQIALLFGLMEQNQPVEQITQLLAAIDNGSITSVQIQDPGSGYAPGYGPPRVEFPPPEAGEGYETATGRAILSPNGRLLRVDVVNRGMGYSKPPTVTISPPAVIRFGAADPIPGLAEEAQAKATLFRGGVNKGRIERIELTNPGAGYTDKEIIRIRISPPDTPVQKGGVQATATAVLEYSVTDIQIVNNGTGYAVEKPIQVYVEPPPLTARVNMNDPLMARIISPNEQLPATSIPTREMRQRMPDRFDPTSVESRVTAAAAGAGGGGGGGCTGRACYDRPVVAVAYPRAEIDVFDAFRNEDDTLVRAQKVEKALEVRGVASVGVDIPPPTTTRVVSASGRDGGGGLPADNNPFVGVGPSSSSNLLALLPAGIGLEFNSELGRYELAVDKNYQDDRIRWLKESRKIDPDFGPRGRSPIERDMKLGIGLYLRFVASGAVCCSAVHLALTPIDVVKTKVQTDPEKYPSIGRAFRSVLNELGPTGFFTGWLPTFVGFLAWGGVSYALTEYFRRTLIEAAGPNAGGLEVPIILTASAAAAFVGSYVICPFEAVRIRSVAQRDYAPNIVGVLNRMVDEEGVPSFFKAVPAFLAKEIPFAMAKFTVFDISTTLMYEYFPAAKESFQLSLVVSLAGGVLGGIVAAIVSNPADATISFMKKAKSDVEPLDAAKTLLQTGGIGALFRGLPLRLVFYMLLVSGQFFVYDAVRIALGVGSDDLKLYLDVLGDALGETGGSL